LIAKLNNKLEIAGLKTENLQLNSLLF